MLIGALVLLDLQYQRFERAAYFRAVVLESKLNLDLTKTIGQVVATKKRVAGLYLLLSAAVGALGAAVLMPNWILVNADIIITAAACVMVVWAVTRPRRQMGLLLH